MRVVLITLTLGLAAGAIPAGCGGDDDGGDAPTPAEFIGQADKICAASNARIDKQAAKVFDSGRPSKAEQRAFAEDVVIPETRGQVDGVRDLTPPEGDEDRITEIIDSADEGIATIQSDPTVLTQGRDPLAEATKLAAEYGMKDCGRG